MSIDHPEYEPWVKASERKNPFTDEFIISRLKNNLTGKKVGKWNVIEITQVKPVKYLCVCECGTERVVASLALNTAISKSCNRCSRNIICSIDECSSDTYNGANGLCSKHYKRQMYLNKFEDPEKRLNQKDLTGQTYGKLYVVSWVPRGWRCKCECGKEVVRRGLTLRTKTGKLLTCGDTETHEFK